MAFGKKTPEEEFKETFGMTREEFDAERAEAKKQKERSDALEAQQTATSTTLTDLQTQLAALREGAKPKPTTQEPTEFFADPEAAIRERMAPVAAAALQSGARVEEMIARNKFSKDFTKYGKEIEDLIKSHASLADKNNPAFYENVVNIVRGRHVAEIEEAALKGTAYFTEQPGGGGAGGGGEDDKDFGLSKEQIAAAARMNMTPKQFKENLDYTMNSYGHTKGAAHVN